MVIVIDNYDSFVYNLVQYLGELGAEPLVYRNDAVTLAEIEEKKPSQIVISPGPCTPREAGISVAVIRHFARKVPILGVCLGHQCLGFAFGAKVVRASCLMHGKTSEIYHDGRTIYEGLAEPFTATRYHSLVLEKETLPSCLEVSAFTAEGEIMGVRHKDYPLEGVQFHPESILTLEGKKLLSSFLDLK